MKGIVMKKLLVCAALALLAIPAAAQSSMQWNTPASTGEIDESSLGIYDYSGARLQFPAGLDGTIVVRYPVVNTNSFIQEPLWATLRMTYLDNNAFAWVTAKLVAVDECSGTEQTMCEIFGEDTGETPGCAICEFDPPLDFSNNAYYIEAQVNRATEFADVALIMLSLQ
jgi:hypothetical protein